MSEANLPVLLEESKAYWVDSASLGLLPDKTLVREWRNIPVHNREECLTYLRSLRTHTNPKAQTKEYTGLYRIQKIEDITVHSKTGGTDMTTIRETMAFGLATTLVGEYARLVGTTDLPSTAKTQTSPYDQTTSPANTIGSTTVEQDYQTVTLRWINLDPQKIEAIVAERSAVTASTLTVAGETITGPFYLLSRKPSWAEDGSGVYEEKWGMAPFVFEAFEKKGDMEVTARRFIQNVPKNNVKAVLDAEIAALGANYGYPGFTYVQRINWGEDTADIVTEGTDTPGKDKTNIADITAGYQIERHTYKHAHDLPDADDIAGHTLGQGKTMSIDGDITDDGDFDYKHIVKTAIKQLSDPALAANVLRVQEASHSSVLSSKQAKNLYDADLINEFAAPSSTPVARTIKTLEKSVNDDGTYDAVARAEVRIDQSIAAPASLLVEGNMSCSPTQTSLTQIIDGSDSAPAPLGTSYGSVAYTKDKFGTYVGSRTVTTYTSNVVIPGWIIGTETSTQYVVDFIQKKSGKWYKRVATITLVEGMHTSLAIAKAACVENGGGFNYAHFKSGYGAIGVGQYWSTNVKEPTFAYTEVTEI